MNMGCNGKKFYTYFTCRFTEDRFKVVVLVDSTDTPESVAKKLQDKVNQMEREYLQENVARFNYFNKD